MDLFQTFSSFPLNIPSGTLVHKMEGNPMWALLLAIRPSERLKTIPGFPNPKTTFTKFLAIWGMQTVNAMVNGHFQS